MNGTSGVIFRTGAPPLAKVNNCMVRARARFIEESVVSRYSLTRGSFDAVAGKVDETENPRQQVVEIVGRCRPPERPGTRVLRLLKFDLHAFTFGNVAGVSRSPSIVPCLSKMAALNVSNQRTSPLSEMGFFTILGLPDFNDLSSSATYPAASSWGHISNSVLPISNSGLSSA